MKHGADSKKWCHGYDISITWLRWAVQAFLLVDV